MKLHLLSLTLGLFLALPATTTLAGSVGPYYATPSWDQTLPSGTRYVQLSNFNNVAYLDRNTGLVWTVPDDTFLSPQYTETHSANQVVAADSCATSIFGGQGGWRLPSISELSSLVEETMQPLSYTWETIHHTAITLPPLFPPLGNFVQNNWNKTPTQVIWSSTSSGSLAYIITVGTMQYQTVLIPHVIVMSIPDTTSPPTVILCVRGG